LIYDKHEGSLIGFANLGEINNHLMKFGDKGVLYKVPNIHSPDPSRYLYFISDPPHLIKLLGIVGPARKENWRLAFISSLIKV